MAEELKACPCPFCGDTLGEDAHTLTDGGFKYGAIQCSCGAIGPDVRTEYKDWPHWKDAAIREWNTRAQLPSQGGEAVIVPKTQTNDQIASVMLQHGTPEQQAEAMLYAGMKLIKKPCKAVAWAICKEPGKVDLLSATYANKRVADAHVASYKDGLPLHITPLYTHPADQVAGPVLVSRELLEQATNFGRPDLMEIALGQLTALLANSEGVKK